jgi:hypothetical protein
MTSAKIIEEIGARVSEAIASSPARDAEKNVRALLSSALGRLDLVTRAEFDVQAQVLLRTREKLEAMTEVEFFAVPGHAQPLPTVWSEAGVVTQRVADAAAIPRGGDVRAPASSIRPRSWLAPVDILQRR